MSGVVQSYPAHGVQREQNLVVTQSWDGQKYATWSLEILVLSWMIEAHHSWGKNDMVECKISFQRPVSDIIIWSIEDKCKTKKYSKSKFFNNEDSD